MLCAGWQARRGHCFVPHRMAGGAQSLKGVFEVAGEPDTDRVDNQAPGDQQVLLPLAIALTQLATLPRANHARPLVSLRCGGAGGGSAGERMR